MANIGFIGLGNMGFPMALNLLKAGHRVLAFDLNRDPLEQFSAAGGQIAQTLESTIAEKNFIFTMLPTAKQVSEVYQSIFPKVGSDSLLIDCSTIDVETSKNLFKTASASHISLLDAPVSGGSSSAASANLTFMVGGLEDAFMKAKPILECMGKKIIHTGIPGSGQAAKICNNMLLGISMIGVSEAFALATKLGLSSDKLFEVVNNSSGQCWAMSRYVPLPGLLENVPANNHYKAGFESLLMLKDLLLSQHEAINNQVSTPLAAKATEMYEEFVARGHGKIDFSAIIKMILSEENYDASKTNSN